MREVFKNPWMWLLVFFLSLFVGVGIFLFGGKSVTVVEKESENVGKEIKQEKLSEEISEEIVKKLEEESGVPEEREERATDDEQGATDNKQQTTNNEQRTADNERGAMNNEQGTMNKEQLATKGERGKEEESNDESQGMNIQNTAALVNRLVSWGFAKSSERKVDTVVIHSTYNALGGDPFSVEKIIGIYQSYGVAPHYMIARDGTVYRLVEEKNIAYHAGESAMKDGRKNVNDFSIGIEIIGKDDGSPSEAQYASLAKLLTDIKSRGEKSFVPLKHIVGHSDIASGRKTDPWGFDWKKIGGKEL